MISLTIKRLANYIMAENSSGLSFTELKGKHCQDHYDYDYSDVTLRPHDSRCRWILNQLSMSKTTDKH